MNNMPVLSLQSLQKSFLQGEHDITVIKDATFQMMQGDMVALIGESGSGKTTLLQIIGLLDTATSGNMFLQGTSCRELGDRQLTKLRRDYLGFVYQFHHLLPEFTALENVMMPCMITGVSATEARSLAAEILTKLHLEHRYYHRPSELSGGEQQRVALARALVQKPSLLLADEPTGNLDPATSERVFSMLVEITKSLSLTALIVTHNMHLAKQMHHVITLDDGVLVPL